MNNEKNNFKENDMIVHEESIYVLFKVKRNY